MNTEVNIPQLRKVVEWAEAEAAKPRALSNWEQDWWVSDDGTYTEYNEEDQCIVLSKDPSCGTCFCIAGQLVYSNLNEGESLRSDEVLDADGNTIASVPGRALEILGLTARTRPHLHPLFNASNTIEDIRRIAEEIAGERL